MVTRLDTPRKLASAGTGFKRYLVPSLFSKHGFLRLLSSRMFFLDQSCSLLLPPHSTFSFVYWQLEPSRKDLQLL